MIKDLNPQLNELVANLHRLDIGAYLRTDTAEQDLLENNLLKYKEAGLDLAKNNNRVWGPPPNKWHVTAITYAFEGLYTKDGMAEFKKLLYTTLKGFILWNKKDKDYSKIIPICYKLKMDTDDVKELKLLSMRTHVSKEKKSIQTTKIPKLAIKDKLCFVIMPFSEEFDGVYESLISPVTKEMGMEPLRVDEINEPTDIVEDIIQNIKKARLIIADLSGMNPNVYYELGYAHALKKDVIMLTQDEASAAPFDIRHKRLITYDSTLGNLENHKNTLRKFIQTTLRKKRIR